MSTTDTNKPKATDPAEGRMRRYSFIEYTTTVNACTIEAMSEDEAWDRMSCADWIAIAVDSDGIDLDRIEDL